MEQQSSPLPVYTRVTTFVLSYCYRTMYSSTLLGILKSILDTIQFIGWMNIVNIPPPDIFIAIEAACV